VATEKKTGGATVVIAVISHIDIRRYETRLSYEKFSVFFCGCTLLNTEFNRSHIASNQMLRLYI